MNSVLRRLGLLTSFFAVSMMPLSFGQSSSMTPDITALTSTTNRFAFDLYDQLATEDNLFVSPFSISLALAMTYGGANGETATQMQDVLGFDLPTRDLANLLGDLSDDLESREGFTLNLANALWAQEDSRFEPEFLLMSRLDYGATLRNLDFRMASNEARRTINAWVNQATNGIIPELLPSNAVTPDTRLILTNAIYFNALWQFPFDPDATELNPFNAFGRESLVPTMRQTRQFTYSEGDTYQTLRLPYQGETTSMLIVLPRDGAFTAVSDDLASTYDTALANQSTRRVNVELPRFEMRSSFDLATTLSNLGMPLAFTPYTPASDCETGLSGSGADFSKLDGSRCLFIDSVIHEAYIDANETRTEAAAATAVAMARTTSAANHLPPVDFIADRPFMVIIHDEISGAILFMGQVVSP